MFAVGVILAYMGTISCTGSSWAWDLAAVLLIPITSNTRCLLRGYNPVSSKHLMMLDLVILSYAILRITGAV